MLVEPHPSSAQDSQRQALTRFREFLSACWDWSHEVHYSTGFNRKEKKPEIHCTYMCRHTSVLLQELICSVDPGWKVAGGWMSDSAHPADPNQPHCWLVRGSSLVDLTAEQFGWDSVVITTTDDPRYRSTLLRLPTARNLKTTLDQWKGVASREWMDRDPMFQAIKEQSAQAFTQFKSAWSAGIPLESQPLVTPKPSRRSVGPR